MIFRKFVTVIRAFFNSIANALWERDPIAIMRLEYDRSVEQLKEGRKGLELYRGLVERVARAVRVRVPPFRPPARAPCRCRTRARTRRGPSSCDRSPCIRRERTDR